MKALLPASTCHCPQPIADVLTPPERPSVVQAQPGLVSAAGGAEGLGGREGGGAGAGEGVAGGVAAAWPPLGVVGGWGGVEVGKKGLGPAPC